MALPNMAMIPSGYKPTKLYSVLPTESLGSELVINGDFSNGSTDWNASAGVTVQDEVCKFISTGSGGTLTSTTAQLISGKQYIVKFEITYQDGFSKVKINNAGASGVFKDNVNLYEQVFTCTSTTYLQFYFTNAGSCFIDNISVQEVLVGDADFDVTRATPATRVNQQGLIETPEFIESGDLITNGDFSNGLTGWGSSDGSVTIVDGGALFTIGGGNNRLYQNIGMQQDYYYQSTYTVTENIGGVQLRVYSGAGYFNVDSTVGTHTVTHKKIGSSNPNYYFNPWLGTSITLDNVSVIQVERNNIPRLDYTDGTCPVLLTEPQSINLVTYSEDFDNASWTKIRTLVTPNSVISPTGSVNASTLSVVGATGGEELIRIQSLDSNEASCSFYVKKGNWRYITLRSVNLSVFDFDTETFTLIGTDETLSFDKLNNGWYRLKASSPTRSYCSIGFAANATTPTAGVGVDGTNMYIWGGQLENLPYSTSIIPTNGSISTRNKDIVNNAGTSATYNSTEGVLFWNGSNSVNGGNPETMITLSDGTSNNVVQLIMHSTPNRIVFRITLAGVGIVNIDSTDVSQTEDLKIGLKYKENDFALWINGVEKATSLGSSFPSNTISTLQFADGNGIKNFFGKTSQVQVFNTALSDFDLQNLTSNATAYASYETMRTSLNFNIQ